MISVIIPAYNDVRHLEKCLASIFAQSFKDLEIIVVDDGSAETAAKKISEIAVGIRVAHFPHIGAAGARNSGFKISSGEFIFFCDADVELKSGCLEKMREALGAHPEAAYAYSDYQLGWKKMPARAFDAKALKKCNYISTMSLIRRADFYGFDESLKRFQDWDLWLTMLERGKAGIYIPEVLFKARSGRTGISKWRPSFWYKLFPWSSSVKAYNKAREIILKKHGS